MISVTGGFNQQFVAGAPKVHKLKYAEDTMAVSDAKAVSLDYVPDILHSYSDAMILLESLGLTFGASVIGDDLDNFADDDPTPFSAVDNEGALSISNIAA